MVARASPSSVANPVDRLDQHGRRRQRPTAGHDRGAMRRDAWWAAQRQAWLAGLESTDVEGSLQTQRVGQGWSVRRMRAELRVNRAWLKGRDGPARHPVARI